jgi:hypothetical protein
MNTRILELYDRTTSFCRDNPTSIDFCEEFANVIIRDCLARIQATGFTKETNSNEWENGYNAGVSRAYTMLKIHFGVE